MGLFGGGEKQIRKEIDKVLHFVLMFMAFSFGEENLAKDLKFERPDSRFRFQILLLSAVVFSVAHKLGDVDVVSLNACHAVTDTCVNDQILNFGGKVDPETVDRQGIDLQGHFFERLNTIGKSSGSFEDWHEVSKGLRELVHEVESPEPLNLEDYERLSEFVGGLWAFMSATSQGF